MRIFLGTYFPESLLIAFLAFFLAACGGGGDGGSVSGTTPPPAPAVVITGTVPGTVAIAYDFATGKEAARSVASGTPKTFSLSLDLGTYYLMFIENEGTSGQGSYGFRNVTGENLFTFTASTTLDLGVLNFRNFRYMGDATPQIDPISGNSHVRETIAPEAVFSPGEGAWTETKTFVNSTCPGHSPGMTVTESVKIAQGYGLVFYDGASGTAGGVANVNTAILTSNADGALVTIVLTMQSDGSLAGTYSKGGECSEEATVTAVLGTSPPSPAAALTALTISGPAAITNDLVTATYSATATWSDGSTSTVTPAWSVNSPMASITGNGVLFFPRGVDNDMVVTVSATYSAGVITKTASAVVAVENRESNTGTPLPFSARMLSGAPVYFEEHTGAGGGYESSLYVFNANSTFQRFVYKNPPDASETVAGTWSINESGELNLDYGGGTQITVVPVSAPDLGLNLWVSVDEGSGTQYTVRWENFGAGAYPFRAVLDGTYVNQYGDTWTFNSDGTGSTTGDGGWTFTWSVTDARLRVVFPNGYVGLMYERPSSRPAMDETIIRWAFLILTNTGEFGAYYGGMALVPD